MIRTSTKSISARHSRAPQLTSLAKLGVFFGVAYLLFARRWPSSVAAHRPCRGDSTSPRSLSFADSPSHHVFPLGSGLTVFNNILVSLILAQFKVVGERRVNRPTVGIQIRGFGGSTAPNQLAQQWKLDVFIGREHTSSIAERVIRARPRALPRPGALTMLPFHYRCSDQSRESSIVLSSCPSHGQLTNPRGNTHWQLVSHCSNTRDLLHTSAGRSEAGVACRRLPILPAG